MIRVKDTAGFIRLKIHSQQIFRDLFDGPCSGVGICGGGGGGELGSWPLLKYKKASCLFEAQTNS